ncbi:hypothetical protein Q669_29555 [Labrenzia sp. C1B10]|uniref:DUF3310 domain-containing protein n=1 Tax=unclassified Labrenzia TaxID=2648686 RepID=UPI0003B8E2D0|nr:MULTISPECIES: DUF3310 domain-containing protein [unclassified Labrenzia]ERP95717.1 hypothetical protein Q669_29555 [Labrenzia sp. C1B10]ERS05783.1 hypothetical protein Q675_29120 [Labrenzia sp. C1B70]
MSQGSLSVQVGGLHYCELPVQPFQLSAARDWDAFAHTIMKYVVRYPEKGGLNDLKKARHVADLRAELHDQTEHISVGEFVKKNGLGHLEEAALLALDIWVKSEDPNGAEYRMFTVLMDRLIQVRTDEAFSEEGEE